MLKIRVKQIIATTRDAVIVKPKIIQDSVTELGTYNVMFFNPVSVDDEFLISEYEIYESKRGHVLKVVGSTKTKSCMDAFALEILKGMKNLKLKKSDLAKLSEQNNLWDKLINKDQSVLTKNLNAEKLNVAAAALRGNSPDVALSEILLMNNLSSKLIVKCKEELGDAAGFQVQKNPFLLNKVGVKFTKCLQIATAMNIKDQDVVLEAFFEQVLKSANNVGHMFLNQDVVFNAIQGIKYKPIKISSDIIKDAFFKLIDEKVLVKEGDRVYLNYFNYIEKEIAKMVTERAQTSFLSNINPVCGETLTESQKSAVEASLGLKNIICITGASGTGKTTTVKTIVANLNRANKSYALLAPTGKAANRLKETCGAGETIHRKLGINPQKNDEELDTMCEDYVIIDECSMIDADLFYKLLKYTLVESKIILVGDPNQLQSVGAGSVFADIIASGIVQTINLDTVFRQGEGSAILTNAHKVLKSENDLIEGADFEFINCEKMGSIEKEIVKVYESDGKMVQTLTQIKDSIIGTNSLNKVIQSTVNKRAFGKTQIEFDSIILRSGDRVIHTKNNYELEVYNGDVGYVVKSSKDPDGSIEVIVDYAGREVVYDQSNLGEITLAYAITTHKSQGSEFKVIIITCHDTTAFMLNKNNIYTAITRAKDKVYVIGDKKLFLEKCKEQAHARNSFLSERIVELNK